MPFLVKYVFIQPSGRTDYRRAYPQDLRAFIHTGTSGTQFKKSLGRPGEAGFHVRLNAAGTECATIVARAKKLKAGAFDPLDGPTIQYLVEAFRQEVLVDDEKAR